jgi:hypothetical protein
MKKPLVSTLFAVPLLTLSSMVFAAEPDSTEPFMLSAAQMDGITAGRNHSSHGGSDARNFTGLTQIGFDARNFAEVTQINISPVVIVQIALFNNGSINQIATVISGNFSYIRQ